MFYSDIDWFPVAEPISQATVYKRKFEIGSHLQIRRQITISHAEITSVVLLHGSFEATRLGNGKIRVPYYGFMANVRNPPIRFPSCVLITVCRTFDSGSGEEYYMVRTIELF
jgi:hypothetical protein